MSLVPVFHADVDESGDRLLFSTAERFLRKGYLKRLAGKPVDVVVRPHRNKRSDKQNKWWWGVALPLIAHELGYDRHEHEKLHYALVSLCFKTTVDRVTKQEIPNVRSSQLTTVQFGELMEWAVRWAAMEHGISVSLPGEAA